MNPTKALIRARSVVVAFLATTALLVPHANSQDATALLDKLVQKGILSSQEAAEVRTDMQSSAAQTSAAKISLSNSVSELDIYGDLRLRYQYNSQTPVLNNGVTPAMQQDRWRYRLRLNADWSLGPDWFAGMQLRTNQASDAGMQTYSTTFTNDSIYISRAFLGFDNGGVRVVAGKQANPFYTTDLIWDPDISPSGLTETVRLTNLSIFGGSGGPDGGAKAGPPPPTGPWEISLVGAQFILGDDSKFIGTGDLANDPWMFDEQLLIKYKFNKNVTLTLGPGFMAENTAHITGALNSLPFSDEGAVISGTTAVTATTQQQVVVGVTYSATGVPTKTITPTTVTTTKQTQVTPNNFTSGGATVSGPRPISITSSASRTGAIVTLAGPASGLPTNLALAGQSFTTTTTGQSQTVKTTNNTTLPAVRAETADLDIINVPGDLSFTLGGLKTRVYWDFAYNVEGKDRFNQVYQMQDFGSRSFRQRDAFTWLAGFSLGEIRKFGDWEFFVDYRETGMASIDPNINDNEAGGGALNMRGVKFGLAYALTDFVVLEGTGYIFRDLDGNTSGGRATSVGGIAPYRSWNEATVEVNVKF